MKNKKAHSKWEIQYKKQLGTLQQYDRNVHDFSYPLPCTSTANIVDDTG